MYNEIVTKELLSMYIEKDIKRSKYFIAVLFQMINYINSLKNNQSFFIYYYTQFIPRKYIKLIDIFINDVVMLNSLLDIIQLKMIELKEKYVKGYNKPIK
jgi:hypothetical protein